MEIDVDGLKKVQKFLAYVQLDYILINYKLLKLYLSPFWCEQLEL